MDQPDADWARAIRPEATAFFLDVDGTLLGFKDRPEDVVADAALLALLTDLRQAANGAVALVSGRMISDLDRIVSPLVLPAGGTHGAELRFADGHREMPAGDVLEHLREEARVFVAARPGLMLEDKGATIAIHYRHAPEHAGAIGQFLATAVEGHDLAVQHGKMVAEVRPRGRHKGVAIDTLMRTAPFSGRRPLFIGDDLTDEHGFESVNAMDGLSIKVGHADEATVARHRLADTLAVRAFFQKILPRSSQRRSVS